MVHGWWINCLMIGRKIPLIWNRMAFYEHDGADSESPQLLDRRQFCPRDNTGFQQGWNIDSMVSVIYIMVSVIVRPIRKDGKTSLNLNLSLKASR